MTKSPKNSPAHQKNPKFSTNPKNSPNFPHKTKFFPKNKNFPKNSKNSQIHKTHTQKPKKSPQTPAKYNSNYNFTPKSPKKFPSKTTNSVRPKTIHYCICKNFHFTDKEFMDFSPFYKRLKMTKSPKNSQIPPNFHKFYKNLQI